MAEREVHHVVALSFSTESPDIASAHARVLRNFAFGHWRAARRFADLLEAHEAAHAGEEFGAQFEDARTFATGAILTAYAAMEAGLNELQIALGTPAQARDATKNGKLIDRLNATLAHHGRAALTKGGRLGRNVELLRGLRNALVHPRAEWDDETATHQALSRKVKSAKLPLNPFLPGGELVFPLGVMSAGVARWAAETAEQFLNGARASAKLPPVIGPDNRGA